MRLLDKYLFRELLIPLGYCLGGFLIILATTDLFSKLDDFQEAQLSLTLIAHYYVLTVPESLVRVLPMGLLLALLYTLTTHARHNELTAIRAAGISLWRLSVPYFAAGAVLVVVTFLINEFWVPAASEAAARLLEHPSKRRKVEPNDHVPVAFKNSAANRTWQIGLYNLKTTEMTNPKIDWTLPDGTRCQYIADRGWRTNGNWGFANMRMITNAPGGAISQSPVVPIYLAKEFDETPEQIRSEVYISRMSPTSRTAEIPLFRILLYLKLHPQLTKSQAHWLYTQLHGRIAAPFTCLVVVFIAIPFGAPVGRRNVFVGVAGSIFIVFCYFVLLSLCMAFGTRGWLPPWLAAWLPNIAFMAVSLWLIRRVR